jgi:leader peptidase (prepilin peptidase) / N-methyltransferase
MIRILGTIFAGLLGLAFGSFLNVCLSRWPEGLSVVRPRSHCRNCDHTLTWWENVPVVSWLALRGRCGRCRTAISWRYPVVELAVAALWAYSAFRSLPAAIDPQLPATVFFSVLADGIAQMALSWLLVALAVLDAENFWLPNALAIPGILLGLVVGSAREQFGYHCDTAPQPMRGLLSSLIAVIVSAAFILLIRWVYKLIRHREGIGQGDAKLMALLAAWLGLPGALLAFGLGAILGAIAALALLAIPAARRGSESWGAAKLPLGTFLCIGGIVSSLWGQPIIAAYLRWAGF